MTSLWGGGLILIRPGWASIIISNSLYSDRDFMGGDAGRSNAERAKAAV